MGYKKNPSLAGGGQFIFKDSYGTDVGQSGYKYETFLWVKKTACDACVVELDV